MAPGDGTDDTPGQAPGKARRKRFHVPSWAALTSDLRVLLLNAALLVLFLLILPVVAVQFIHSQVIIQSFPVPPALVARGLTPEVAANRLWDGLHDEIALAGTSKEAIAALPVSQRVDFAIPDSGISIDSLVYYVRHFFHADQTRISGELRCADANCAPEGVSLRIRVMRDGLDIIQMPPIGTTPEAEYFREAAGRVLDLLDPFTAAAARAERDPMTALATAERLVRMHHPDAVWAANLIGNIKMREGDTEGAVAAYRTALDLKPDFQVAETNLATTLVAAGKLDEADRIFARLVQAGVKDKYLSLGRARLAVARNDTDGAVALWMEAEALDPGTPQYLFLAGEAELRANHLDKAEEFGRRALAVAPADYGAVMLLNAAETGANRLDEAEALLARAVLADPAMADFRAQHAILLLQLGRGDAALSEIDAAKRLSPETLSYGLTRANVLMSLNRPDEALAEAARVVTTEPQNAQALLIQGQALAALDRTEEARAAYLAASKLDAEGYGAIAKAYLAVLDQQAKLKAPPG